jgi:septal ring factor EnvC (AmiA/AmiB activator)
MEQADLTRRLDAIDARLERLDRSLAEADRLREALDHERQSRRELAEQAQWLVETLGETRRELRWLRQEHERLLGERAG